MRRWTIKNVDGGPLVVTEGSLDLGEAVEVIPLREVKEALLGDPKTLKAILHFMEIDDRGSAEATFDAAFPSTDSEGER